MNNEVKPKKIISMKSVTKKRTSYYYYYYHRLYMCVFLCMERRVENDFFCAEDVASDVAKMEILNSIFFLAR